MKGACLVDTNVAITANGKNHMSAECVVACQHSLNQLMLSGRLVIDDQWKILGEYMNKLHPQGQPGLGDAFLKWVLTHQTNAQKVEMVSVTSQKDVSGNVSYKEFPDDTGLADFDPSDRVFIAVAASHVERPPILQATDSKWLGKWNTALLNAGIKIDYLCEDELQQIYDRKFS